MSKRQSSLRDRQKKSYEEKDGAGFSGKSIFDLDKHKIEKENLFYKIKEGKNLIDIIPFVVKSSNNPHVEKGNEDYVLDIYVHRNVGPGCDEFVCPKRNYKQACPICEEVDRMRTDGAEQDEMRPLWASRRVYYNVIDLLSDDSPIQILAAGHSYFEKELQEESATSDEVIVFAEIDEDEGRSIQFRGSEETFPGGKWIKPKGFKFIERKKGDGYKDAIIDEAIPLDSILHIPTYEEIEASFFGKPEEDASHGGEVEEEPDEKPSRRRRGANDEEPASEDKSTRRSREKDEESETECPHGHKFGKDFEEYECCDKCDLWDGCGEVNDKLKD